MSAPCREERIRMIQESLKEWCVDTSRHEEFCAKAMARVDTLPPSLIPQDLDVSDLAKSPALPKSVKDAIHFVLSNEIQNVQEAMEEGETFTFTEDRCSPHHFAPMKPQQPQFRDHKAGRTKAVPKFEFRATDPRTLDPFRRFTYTKFNSAPEYFAAQWHSQPACFDGHVWEAVVSHWMEYSGTKCFCCESKSCLRWIGGLNGLAWGDVVCVECKALYEIKSKATIDKVHKCLFQYNSVQCGSFLNFAEHRRLGKKYLVIVSRQPGQNDNHPIYGLEIETVAPTLTDTSFDLERRDLHIGSVISVKVNAASSYVKGILRPLRSDFCFHRPDSIFDEHFGEGEWSRQIAAVDKDLSSQFQALQLSASGRLSMNQYGQHVSARAYPTGPWKKTVGRSPRQTPSVYKEVNYDVEDTEEYRLSSKQRFKVEDTMKGYSNCLSGQRLMSTRKCKKWYNR
jgi:hypothetical protein